MKGGREGRSERRKKRRKKDRERDTQRERQEAGWACDLGSEQLEVWSCLLLPFTERRHWEKEVRGWDG